MGEPNGLDGKLMTVSEAVERKYRLGVLAFVEPHRLVSEQRDPMRKERQVRKTRMSRNGGSRQESFEETTRDGDLMDRRSNHRRATGRPALSFLTVR
jgi:hypothetical protein